MRPGAKIAAMPAESKSHPDRHAATLMQLVQAAPTFAGREPGAGSRDCRIDTKLLLWRAQQACARSDAARAHLQRWPQAQHPDLWAGTVQDGVNRGFAVALEEAIAFATTRGADPFVMPRDAVVTTGKELRRRREVLLASAGPRVRFSRKMGLLFVDRDGGVATTNCLRFEARRDQGTLDRFEPVPDERPRLFSAQFLPPVHLIEGAGHTLLRLEGRLGRKAIGWGCAVTILARSDEHVVRLRVEISTPQSGWRLRARFLGLPQANVHHHCTDVSESVRGPHGDFLAFTLVRACGLLEVDGAIVAVPDAAAPRTLVHDFELRSGAADGQRPELDSHSTGR